MKRVLAIIPAAALLFLSSCDFTKERVRGNGNVKTETRNSGTFHSIDVGGAIDVYVKQDSISSVRVVTDENLMGYVKTESNGERLSIYTQRGVNLSGTQNVKVYVSGPSFSHLEASGASNIYGETRITSSGKIGLHATGASSVKLDIDAPSIEADITGASDMTLRGTTKSISVDCTGASGFRGFELMTENADVDASGASHADVFASVKLDASASGASHIKYKGNASVNRSESGAGSVSKVD